MIECGQYVHHVILSFSQDTESRPRSLTVQCFILASLCLALLEFACRALGSGCPQSQTNAVSMRRSAQLETGWFHLGHKELGSWSLLVSMGGAGQKGQSGHVLWGDSERNENFKRKC